MKVDYYLVLQLATLALGAYMLFKTGQIHLLLLSGIIGVVLFYITKLSIHLQAIASIVIAGIIIFGFVYYYDYILSNLNEPIFQSISLNTGTSIFLGLVLYWLLTGSKSFEQSIIQIIWIAYVLFVEKIHQ